MVMLLVVFRNGTAAKATTAKQAAAMTLASEQADAMIDSEEKRKEFVKAHDTIVSGCLQRGVSASRLKPLFPTSALPLPTAQPSPTLPTADPSHQRPSRDLCAECDES